MKFIFINFIVLLGCAIMNGCEQDHRCLYSERFLDSIAEYDREGLIFSGDTFGFVERTLWRRIIADAGVKAWADTAPNGYCVYRSLDGRDYLSIDSNRYEMGGEMSDVFDYLLSDRFDGGGLHDSGYYEGCIRYPGRVVMSLWRWEKTSKNSEKLARLSLFMRSNALESYFSGRSTCSESMVWGCEKKCRDLYARDDIYAMRQYLLSSDEFRWLLPYLDSLEMGVAVKRDSRLLGVFRW